MTDQPTRVEPTQLVKTYEAIRRREYELITELLQVLPKIDALEEERVAQVRDALFHADHPFLMVFVGPFSSGKSSLINALLGTEDLLRVGPVPTTDRISILRYGDEAQRMDSGGEVDTVFYPSPLLRKVSFVDTPGLESVFQRHEETTRKFLHRSDVVMLVMLATQAMTQRNLDYMQQLRQYGKKVIILINQADLLSVEESDTVRDYVLDQSQDRLGFKPEVWLVSARNGLEAHQGATFDEALWTDSGLYQIQDFVDDQLSDVERLRQKLQTPLQIIQNVHGVALVAVKANQSVLDQYQSIADNVNQQLAAYKREQEKIVREIVEDIRAKFDEAARRGGLAIREIFQLSQTLLSIRRGLADLTGLSRLFRRQENYARAAFEQHNVYEPINQLPDVAERLGPRMEGKDLQDIDDLVKYANREIKALPPNIRGKVIGEIQAPLQYDRRILQSMRPDLDAVQAEAREVETGKLEQSLRNVLFLLAVWELLLIAIIAVLAFGGAIDFAEPVSVGVLMFLIGLALLGPVLLPLLGRSLETGHINRMLKLQNQYIEVLTKTADRQIDYGMQLRREVVAPLTRLVETQTQIQTEQMNRLQAAEQEMVSIESELTRLRDRAAVRTS